MKKAAALFLLVLLVSAQTPLGQLFKIPVLVEHFIKHQQRDGDTLLGFLTEHYATEHDDADLPEDEQLPFKNSTLCNTGSAIVTPFFQANELALLPVRQKIVFPGNYTPQPHLSSIFHPPRALVAS